MGGRQGKLIGASPDAPSAFRWWVRYGGALRSKQAFEQETETLYQHRRQEAMERASRTGEDPAILLAEVNGWRAGRAQPCFLDPGYKIYQEHSEPPSLAGLVWDGWRRLAGDRVMIVMPMGGVVPGPIPWFNSEEFFDRNDVDPDDRNIWRDLWAVMDSIQAEAQKS